MKKTLSCLINLFSFLRIFHNEKNMGPIIFQGIVDRVTFHNESNGWSVLKVSSFKDPGKLITVLIHQEKVFPGATMEFHGDWVFHAKFGEQFKATNAIEKKPATTAAIEKYLGSGLIKGVGPPTAKKIVKFFKDETLSIFENDIQKLLMIPGIASKKLKMITESWEEHKSIRDVMIFLQSHGLSTLYAVKIFKTYGDKSIDTVSENPYRLANDIHGIGFFTADKIALNLGFERTGTVRIEASIKHTLQASREMGHCYLIEQQIVQEIHELLQETELTDKIIIGIKELTNKNEIRIRVIDDQNAYYSKSLFYDELNTANRIKELLSTRFESDQNRIDSWVRKYCESQNISLSEEQQNAVCKIATQSFSILTGGPGCGKTTTTKVLVKLLQAMKKRVLLGAPTGRAAQRMTEVIEVEAKTLHRLLEWNPVLNNFSRNEFNTLETDFLIIDECSMLDISLSSKLLKAVSNQTQLLFIGDPDQLPSVGAGNVLKDLLSSPLISTFKLTKIFRQAEASLIVRYAHQINKGEIPQITSPIINKDAFRIGIDCLFLDSDEATKDQIKFISRAKFYLKKEKIDFEIEDQEILEQSFSELQNRHEDQFIIPEKFKHVNLEQLLSAKSHSEELKQVLKKVHPWSSLHFGLNALESVVRLYIKTIPEWFGRNPEIQILCPQVRGTLGTMNLNHEIQSVLNPSSPSKRELKLGERIFRESDRVIQTKNNYELGVFNGDIGKISKIDNHEMKIEVIFSGEGKRRVIFSKEDLIELALAYSITVHKSQGSEFEVVIIPVLSQHFNMLFRNLIYTGVTRAKKLAIFVGSRKALNLAIKRQDQAKRQTALSNLLMT
jgi:exodeoxyribonuclease V alpha subunit